MRTADLGLEDRFSLNITGQFQLGFPTLISQVFIEHILRVRMP